MAIIILGLGPGAWEQVTLEAKAILDGAKEVYLRTSKHPTVQHLPPHLVLHSFDDLYDTCPTFERLYKTIVEKLLELARSRGDIIYAVPGHPIMGEATVQDLLAKAKKENIPVRVVSGLSFLEPVLALLQINPLAKGLQIVDVLQPRLDPTLPALVCQVYDQGVASSLKLDLLELYPPEHEAILVRAAGVEGQERLQALPLHELDRKASFDPLTCLYLPPLPIEEDLRSFTTLEHIVARLRAPGGCPWDREQTHTSIKAHLIEEAYEVLAALDKGDIDDLCEELGDLLMQIMLHSQIAAEADEFDIRDVIRGINTKLIRRHPHVFGDLKFATSQDVLLHWETLKQGERGEEASALASVPKQMPALAYSQAIQERAARVGFDWKALEGVLEKLVEELQELKRAQTKEERLKEFGDLLFALTNAARWLKVDSEEALRLANERFYRRFLYMEEVCRKSGRHLKSLSFEEKNALWEEAKKRES